MWMSVNVVWMILCLSVWICGGLENRPEFGPAPIWGTMNEWTEELTKKNVLFSCKKKKPWKVELGQEIKRTLRYFSDLSHNTDMFPVNLLKSHDLGLVYKH